MHTDVPLEYKNMSM